LLRRLAERKRLDQKDRGGNDWEVRGGRGVFVRRKPGRRLRSCIMDGSNVRYDQGWRRTPLKNDRRENRVDRRFETDQEGFRQAVLGARKRTDDQVYISKETDTGGPRFEGKGDGHKGELLHRFVAKVQRRKTIIPHPRDSTKGARTRKQKPALTRGRPGKGKRKREISGIIGAKRIGAVGWGKTRIKGSRKDLSSGAVG